MIPFGADFSCGWHRLGGGAWLFVGKQFSDARGTSHEVCDVTHWCAELPIFVSAQENVVFTRQSGTARGLHYQLPPLAHAKLVTMLRGSAQFFWLPLDQASPVAQVFSIVLTEGAASLYTPANVAHGMLALTDQTQFLLKMSEPVSVEHRAEISFLAGDLSIDVAQPIQQNLLSERDRMAPKWSNHRPFVVHDTRS